MSPNFSAYWRQLVTIVGAFDRPLRGHPDEPGDGRAHALDGLRSLTAPLRRRRPVTDRSACGPPDRRQMRPVSVVAVVGATDARTDLRVRRCPNGRPRRVLMGEATICVRASAGRRAAVPASEALWSAGVAGWAGSQAGSPRCCGQHRVRRQHLGATQAPRGGNRSMSSQSVIWARNRRRTESVPRPDHVLRRIAPRCCGAPLAELAHPTPTASAGSPRHRRQRPHPVQ